MTRRANWKRDGVLINGNDTMSNHFITPYNSTGQGRLSLIITNVSVADNGAELSCTYSLLIFYSASVTLQVVGMFKLLMLRTYCDVDTKPSNSIN